MPAETATTASTLRDRNARRTRDGLVDAAVELIEERREPTMRAVAARAGVGERTVYRYFPNRDALSEAVAERLAERAGVPLCRDEADLEDYARRLFGVFDADAGLIEALLTSASRDLAPTRSRNLVELEAVIDRGFPDAPRPDRRAAAAALRTLLSGSGWFYQRQSCGLSQERVVANAIWLIGTIRGRLRGASTT